MSRRCTKVAGWMLLLPLGMAMSPSATAEPAVGPEKGSQVVAQGPVAVMVELEGYDTDPLDVQVAVAKELGVAVTPSEDAASALVRVVAKKGGDLRVTYEAQGEAPLMRVVAAPERDDEVAEAAALLAGNLARDQVSEILASLEPPPDPEATPAAPPPEPAPEPEPSKEPEPPPKPTPRPHYPINLTLFHPATIVPRTEQARLGVELGLFYSRVGELDAFALNPFVLRVDGEARGAQVAGLVSLQGEGGRGAHIAGLFSHQGGDFDGATLTAGVQISEGHHTGFKASGALSHHTGSFTGGMVSGAASTMSGPLHGVQAAGALNVAGSVEGAQLGPTNISGDVSGAQIGIVNVGGRVDGFQLGIVNIAEDVHGASIGLVTYSSSGRVQPVAWYSTRSPANLGLRLYTGPLYAMPTLSFDVRSDPDAGNDVTSFSPGLALGARVPIRRAFLDVDAHFSNPAPQFRYDEHTIDLRYRLIAGYELTPAFAPLIGAGVHHHFRTVGDPEESFTPEFVVGVQFL